MTASQKLKAARRREGLPEIGKRKLGRAAHNSPLLMGSKTEKRALSFCFVAHLIGKPLRTSPDAL